jgi:hypothetical protein
MAPDQLQDEVEHTELKRKLMEEFSDAERWGWLADTLRSGDKRMTALDGKCAPCKRWHGIVLKGLLSLLLGGALTGLGYLASLVGKHVFGG